MIYQFIRKIIEWDKKRKFGHAFQDYIVILFTYAFVNTLMFFISGKINFVLIIVTATISVLLWNRTPPE